MSLSQMFCMLSWHFKNWLLLGCWFYFQPTSSILEADQWWDNACLFVCLLKSKSPRAYSPDIFDDVDSMGRSYQKCLITEIPVSCRPIIAILRSPLKQLKRWLLVIVTFFLHLMFLMASWSMEVFFLNLAHFVFKKHFIFCQLPVLAVSPWMTWLVV